MDTCEDLGTVLGSLEDRDLIRREAVSRIAGDQQFGFKHGLIHDVAYGTLPRAARRERHAAVARFLASSTDVGQTHEALAHHWREAGENQLALEQFEAAADQAGRGWAKERAVKLYSDALKLVAEGDDATRKRLRMRQVVAVQALSHLHRWTCRAGRRVSSSSGLPTGSGVSGKSSGETSPAIS